jgi:hypothetical protein
VTAGIHNRERQLSVIAVVAALHIVVCWVLLAVTEPLKIRTASSTLELIYLTFDVPKSVARRSAPARRAESLERQGTGTRPLNRPQPLSQPSAAAGEQDNAIHPPIDWANELNRTARESASGASAPQPREFGAPHIAPSPPAKPPEFGWAHSRTHRVETGPDGMTVHLGDHCVIAFTPLPFPICALGKTEANGDLFKHMRDPPKPGDWKDSQ